jgi:YbgC/YbaW family acyl-CoA thioester hydrolase
MNIGRIRPPIKRKQALAVDSLSQSGKALGMQEAASQPQPPLAKTKFETELQVRPDDIDMNQHVHGSRYFDYVLAARYDQMERCYKMAMAEFIAAGYNWFVKITHIEYKRPLRMGEKFVVRTWVDDMTRDGVKVRFEIERSRDRKRCADGYFDYTMVNLKNGRAEVIPQWIVEKYRV